MSQPSDFAGAPKRELQEELSRFEDRMIRQRDALVRLASRQMAEDVDSPQFLNSILEVSAGTLEVERASIWRFNAAHTALECLDLYERELNRHSSGAILNARDFPDYFQALAESDVIDANHAETDPRTREFKDSYLVPNGIQSMIDAPLRFGGAMDGVLCHEQVGRARHWTADEKAFVVAVSNAISLALERHGRRRAESTLVLQSAALNAAADAMFIADRDGILVWANPALTRLTGYTAAEAIGQNLRTLFKSGVHDSPFSADMWQTLLAGRVWRGELPNRKKDGTLYVEDSTITPVTNSAGEVTHFVALKRDLTETRQLESQFLQAQKMEVVGRLAGGIAHDFNNLLTVINGTAELAMMDLDPNHPTRAEFERIRESGLRAASLTRQLLAFSRKQITRREPVDLGQLLNNFRSMLQRLIGEDITLIVETGQLLDTVAADPSQLEQVVLNLAVNARDAMPRGGRLTLATTNVCVDDAFAATHSGLKAGNHVLLAVTDTGTGMSQETLARLFEPFFTTKEAGKGTGLGLATVYAIVKQSGGTVWATSELGRGTTFQIYLPSSPASEIVPVVAEAAGAEIRGQETVLLVEDEDAVRDLTTRILQDAGYTVLAARDADSALERLRTGGADVELIITDVVLPGMGGRDLTERARQLRPGVPVLYTSGYTEDTVLAHGISHNTVHFIGKPYTVLALTNKIRDVMRQSRTTGGVQ